MRQTFDSTKRGCKKFCTMMGCHSWHLSMAQQSSMWCNWIGELSYFARAKSAALLLALEPFSDNTRVPETLKRGNTRPRQLAWIHSGMATRRKLSWPWYCIIISLLQALHHGHDSVTGSPPPLANPAAHVSNDCMARTREQVASLVSTAKDEARALASSDGPGKRMRHPYVDISHIWASRTYFTDMHIYFQPWCTAWLAWCQGMPASESFVFCGNQSSHVLLIC